MIDIIIMALVAVFIFLRLRGELGNTHSDEPTQGGQGPSLGGFGAKRGDKPVLDAAPAAAEAEPTVLPFEEDADLRKSYQQIHSADRNFDPAGFLEGATSAYQMILESFWAGDKDSLKTYLSEAVFAQFSGAVDAREQAGQRVQNKIVDLVGAKITGAALIEQQAEITVSFKAEIIAVTRDSENRVVSGNPSDVVEVNDVWTFSRDTRSADPTWSLVSTRAG